MFDALTYKIMLEQIRENCKNYGIVNDMIGILITRPQLPVGKQIMNDLSYYHFRTGNSINFYLPGYCAYCEYPDSETVTVVAGEKWCFSDKMFVSFIEDLEKNTKWKYSGESELLLVEWRNGRICFQNTMQFYLDKMIRDKVIDAVNQFFENLFRMTKDASSLKKISNNLGKNKFYEVSRDILLEKMPLEMGNIFKQEKYFCVSNIGRY